eukprot:scaffold1672_cov155-Ochromonas_danica.AAC.6
MSGEGRGRQDGVVYRLRFSSAFNLAHEREVVAFNLTGSSRPTKMQKAGNHVFRRGKPGRRGKHQISKFHHTASIISNEIILNIYPHELKQETPAKKQRRKSCLPEGCRDEVKQ